MLPLHCFNVVVQFEFEFFEFGFKLNLFEVFCKKKKKTFLFSLPLFLLSAQTASPAQSAPFSLSARGPTSLPRPSLARAPAHPRLPLLCRRQAGPARRILLLPVRGPDSAESERRTRPPGVARTPRGLGLGL